jgi:hypothetical protein
MNDEFGYDFILKYQKKGKILAVLFGYYSENDYICKLKKKD